jgi:hypothetical protein
VTAGGELCSLLVAAAGIMRQQVCCEWWSIVVFRLAALLVGVETSHFERKGMHC